MSYQSVKDIITKFTQVVTAAITDWASIPETTQQDHMALLSHPVAYVHAPTMSLLRSLRRSQQELKGEVPLLSYLP